MEKTNRELLIRDICSRLPYGVFVKFRQYTEPLLISIKDALAVSNGGEMLDDIQYLYLRPMLSMTEEERKEYRNLCNNVLLMRYNVSNHYPVIDWLNAHHFDYRGLISMGLALEAPEGMYKTE